MKNKIKKLLKQVKLIHILLIVLILVVFFGLFKREIPRYTKSFVATIVYLLPQVRNQGYDIGKPCKVNAENPKWKEEWNKICGHGMMSFECTLNGPMNGEPYYKGLKDGTCIEKVIEKQFWAFGISWFKVDK